jgi:hypothetical protein
VERGRKKEERDTERQKRNDDLLVISGFHSMCPSMKESYTSPEGVLRSPFGVRAGQHFSVSSRDTGLLPTSQWQVAWRLKQWKRCASIALPMEEVGRL